MSGCCLQRIDFERDVNRAITQLTAMELTAALRGTGNCAVAWLRAEVRNMRSTRLPGDALSQN